MKATLKDIAEEAGLSISSVSRALNNTGRISEEKRKAVFKIAKELNYTPNANARELKMQRSSTIGVIIPDLANTFFVRLLKAIDISLWERGYNIIFCDSDENIEKEREYYRLLKEKNVAGMIICPVSKSDIYEEEAPDVNCVFVDNEPYITEKPYSFVSIDNVKASIELTQRVIDAGYRDIVMITGSLDETSSSQRLTGFQTCLKNNNIELTNDKVYFSNCRYQGGYEIVERMIENKNLPECIFFHNNQEAYGAYAALRKHHIKVPEDICLVCFDGKDPMLLQDQDISGVIQSIDEIAGAAVDMVLNNLKGPVKYKRRLVNYSHFEGNTLKKMT